MIEIRHYNYAPPTRAAPARNFDFALPATGDANLNCAAALCGSSRSSRIRGRARAEILPEKTPAAEKGGKFGAAPPELMA